MDVEQSPAGPSGQRPGPRRRDRRGRGRRWDLIPPHLPGHRTRREQFDDAVADVAAALTERFPRRLAHLQVVVEEVPPSDPAPWEHAGVLLGRGVPATREHPPRVVVYRRSVQTRCGSSQELEMLLRQVLSEQVASILGLPPEVVDPDIWED